MTVAIYTVARPKTFKPPVPVSSGWVPRLVLKICGLAMMLSAFGLWVVDGTRGVPDLLLMKLGVSAVMLILGMCLITLGRSD